MTKELALRKDESELSEQDTAIIGLENQTPGKIPDELEASHVKYEKSLVTQQEDFERENVAERERLFILRVEIDVARKNISEKEARLATRERKVKDLEIEASAGFAEMNRNALLPLAEQQEKLRKLLAEQEVELVRSRREAIELLDRELRAQRERSLKELETELDKTEKESLTRQERLSRVLEKERIKHHQIVEEAEKSLKERETALHDRDRELRQRERELQENHAWKLEAELERAKQQFSAEQAKRGEDYEMERQRRLQEIGQTEKLLEDREISVRNREREVGQTERELRDDLDDVEKEKQRIDERVTERSRREVETLNSRLAGLQRENADLREMAETLRQRLSELEEINNRLGFKRPEEVLENQQNLEKKVQQLTEELSKRPRLEVKEQLESLLKERGEWLDDRRRLVLDLGQLQAKEGNWLRSVNELELARDLKESAERRRDALLGQMEKYEDEVARLRSLYEKPQEIQARIGVIEKPIFPRATASQAQNEIEWIDGIYQDCVDSGISFNKRLLTAYHTAVKTSEWSPITVLAGVSGTGKSELPRLYARFGGMNFQGLAVQPNWDSSQSLFGYFNSVDNRFNATPLLRAMAQSQREATDKDGFSDRLMMVLLDEMNLSHVELYFSDLLSKLEERRGQKETPALEVDLGAGLEKLRVPLGKNVFWTGTMNQDETTKSLSDKVLDRSNVIVFPRPQILKRRERPVLLEPRPLLPLSTWNTWSEAQCAFPEEAIKPYKDCLEEMNSLMENAGRALGHRVWQSIEAYMANHPVVVDAWWKDDDDLGEYMNIAFEDQLVQKVMPKLRGIETTGSSRSRCLDPIYELLERYDMRITEDFKIACSAPYGSFVWSTAKYLGDD